MLVSSTVSMYGAAELNVGLSNHIDEWLPVLGQIACVCMIVLVTVLTVIGAIVKYAENRYPEE